jgi:hypothetical protein
LQHETFNHAVKGHVVIIAAAGEIEEICAGAAADKETRPDKQASRWLGADPGFSIFPEQTAPRRLDDCPVGAVAQDGGLCDVH